MLVFDFKHKLKISRWLNFISILIYLYSTKSITSCRGVSGPPCQRQRQVTSQVIDFHIVMQINMQLYKVIKLCLLVAALPLVLAKTAIVCSQYEQSEMDDAPKCTKRFILPGEQSCNCNKINNCPTIKYHFPRDNQIDNYARYRYYVPQMKDVTICMWVETREFPHEDKDMSLLSYATSDNANERKIFFKNGKIATIGKNNFMTYGYLDVLNFQQKVHICVSLSHSKQQSAMYLNGEVSTIFHHDISILKGGGNLTLAQEQDAVDDKDQDDAESPQTSQTFKGNITNPMIWPRVLSDDEIRNIATSCQCPQDYAVAFTTDKTEVHGKAYYSIPDGCPTL